MGRAKKRAPKRQKKRAPKREPSRKAPPKTAGGRRPPAVPASKTLPRGSFTVNSTAIHASGSGKSGKDEVHPIDVPLGVLSGFWVSAGALVYGEPVSARVGREELALARKDITCVMFPLEEGAARHQGVRFDLPAAIKFGKGGSVTLRWRNQSGKRCGHYVACVMKGK